MMSSPTPYDAPSPTDSATPPDTSPAPSVSVVISAFTQARWPQLLAAVASVAAQRTPAELVVVIDHNDALLAQAQAALPELYRERASRAAAPGGSLIVRANTQAQGLSGARNSGVAASRGEIIAFLDDDAVAEPDWLTQLTLPYRDPQVLGVGGAVLPKWPGAAPRWLPEEFWWVLGCSYRGGPETEAPVRNFIGCNMSFRRSVLAAVGDFRVGVGRLGSSPEGGEETELCIRVRQHYPEGRLLHRPNARVAHQIDSKRLNLRYFLARCYAEGVSKARVAGTVGRADALAAERAYTRKVLPQGVLRGIKAPFRGDPSGVARAAAIVLGLGVTASGYLLGLMRGYARAQPGGPSDAPQEVPKEVIEAAAAFQPVQLLELDLAEGLPDLRPATSEAGQPYRRALILVRLRAQPLGTVELELPPTGIGAQGLAEQIWAQLAPSLKPHLRDLHPSLGAPGAAPGDETRPPVERRTPETWPFVSVIIATHDRTQSLKVCLDSVAELDYPNFEVVVVDNAPSTPETALLIQQDRSGRLRYVREDVPGLAVAHNRGLQEARGDILAFTDDDVRVDRYWLKELVAGFFAADKVGCVTGMIIPAELETPAQGWLEQYGGFNKGFELRVFDLEHNRPEGALYPYTAGVFGSGANMAFSREALLAIGGFDPALGAGSKGVGGDDLAAFFDVVTRGYTLVYQPAALLHHHHRRDYPGLQRQAYGYGVGLTAYLTKIIIDRPARLFEITPLIPRALMHAFSPTSSKNAKKRADYPSELGRLELKGMLYGPLAYLRSRLHVRRLKGRVRTPLAPAVATGRAVAAKGGVR